MQRFIFALSTILLFTLCKNEKPNNTTDISKELTIQIDTFPMSCSIRAIEAISESTVWFGGSKGQFGYTEDSGQTWMIDSIQSELQPKLEFRGIAMTDEAVFLLAVGSPALLYKSTDKGNTWNIVYQENHKAAFYDAISFWDNKNGIAMGDPTEDCLSVILTNDGGETWAKIPCEKLPATAEGEAAFAASNSNISLSGNHAWIVSGGSKARVFHSPDKGKTWEVFNTPIVQGDKMTGIFSSAFYDEKNGIIIGGNWEKKEQNTKNKAVTSDGGKTWSLISDGKNPGYRSSVQYISGADGQKILTCGIPGISYSADGGKNWKKLSSQSFYTMRIIDSKKSAWLAGANKIGKMTW